MPATDTLSSDTAADLAHLNELLEARRFYYADDLLHQRGNMIDHLAAHRARTRHYRAFVVSIPISTAVTLTGVTGGLDLLAFTGALISPLVVTAMTVHAQLRYRSAAPRTRDEASWHTLQTALDSLGGLDGVHANIAQSSDEMADVVTGWLAGQDLTAAQREIAAQLARESFNGTLADLLAVARGLD